MYLNQTSFNLSKEILAALQDQIKAILLIKHSVQINWRQTYLNQREKITHLEEGLFVAPPLKEKWYFIKDFLNLESLPKIDIKNNHVWSLASKVLLKDNNLKYAHIPMMNFHPETEINDVTIIEESVKFIRPKEKGAILDSGRYCHYYGLNLLSHNEWLKMLADFLLPCVLISPRYIGLSLNRGYCTLRLTADNKFKPKTPSVIKII